MALVPKVTRTASEVSLLVTSADANGYIADIATLLFWAVRIYIFVTLLSLSKSGGKEKTRTKKESPKEQRESSLWA